MQRLRRDFDAGELRIGGGEPGGKASGLVFFNAMLAAEFDPSKFAQVETGVPAFGVVGTDFFDEFLARAGFDEARLAESTNDEIAVAFQRVPLPAELVGRVRELLEV